MNSQCELAGTAQFDSVSRLLTRIYTDFISS